MHHLDKRDHAFSLNPKLVTEHDDWDVLVYVHCAPRATADRRLRSVTALVLQVLHPPYRGTQVRDKSGGGS